VAPRPKDIDNLIACDGFAAPPLVPVVITTSFNVRLCRLVDPVLRNYLHTLPSPPFQYHLADFSHIAWRQLQISPTDGDALCTGRPIKVINCEVIKKMFLDASGFLFYLFQHALQSNRAKRKD